jgi:hypothetical protein
MRFGDLDGKHMKQWGKMSRTKRCLSEKVHPTRVNGFNFDEFVKNLISNTEYRILQSIKDDGRFYLINFHPLVFAFSFDPTGRASRRLPCLTGSAYSAFIFKGSA